MYRRSAWTNALRTKAQPFLALAYLAYALVAYGMQWVPAPWDLYVAHHAGLGLILLQALLVLLTPPSEGETFWRTQRNAVAEWLWVGGVLACFLSPGLFSLACSVTQLVLLARFATLSSWWTRLFPNLMGRPAQTLASSFLLLIGFGTLLLMLPRATLDGLGASWIDAIFTSTSATCVTGLTVLNTAQDSVMNLQLATFSRFGQTVILMLIQVGGLSIMTLSAALVMLAGKHLDLRSRAALGDLMDEAQGRPLETAVSFILKMTLTAEVVGAALLFVRFYDMAPTPGEAVYWSVFHSISAFCNAGFSLFGDNLMRFSTDPLVSLTISGLIIVGGLGYATVAVMTFSIIFPGQIENWRRWFFHARLAGVTTAILLFVGTLFTFYVEYNGVLSELSLGGKLLASFFQSVTTRTAGFNTVDIASLSRVTVLFYVAFMFIGASPGGTGGGVKTTTIGVVVLGIRAVLLGRREVEAWKRHVDAEVVLRSMSIIAISGAAIAVIWGALLVFQPEMEALTLLFETVSAFGTVGLSLGITPLLSVGGKLALVLLMFVGRIGPLGLAFALRERERPVDVRYPTAKVAVG